MTFPPHDASIIRNEAGEPLGWDVPGEPEYDPDDYLPGEDDMDDSEEYHSLRSSASSDQTWPDLDGRCEDLIKEAFTVLNEAPGFRKVYADVQNKLAEAIRLLRGTA